MVAVSSSPVLPGARCCFLKEKFSTALAEEEKQECSVPMVGNNGLEPLTLCL